jgi:hypothetical protein
MRSILGLASRGVPWDVVVDLDHTTRMAWNIIVGEITTGMKWDFTMMDWQKR